MSAGYTTDYMTGLGLFHRHPGIENQIDGIDASAIGPTDDGKVLTANYETGGNDSNVVLLMDMDSDFTDSSDGATETHTPTVTNATIDTVNKVFGAGAGLFDGTAKIEYADSVDWNLAADKFCLDSTSFISGSGLKSSVIKL